MIDAVMGSILENLALLELIFEPTIDVFRGDRTNTGDAKEITVNDFVASYMPADYRVKKGKIYSLSGESNNIDCVVLSPNHPPLITPKRSIILAEGVYAAIEVKPDISVLTDSGEFLRGLMQVKSIKNLHREVEMLDIKLLNQRSRPDYFKKIPAVLFSNKSARAEDMIAFMIEKVKSGKLKAQELPDVIVTMDHGLIMYTPHVSFTAFAAQFNREQLQKYGEEVYFHFEAPNKAVTLGLFLQLLLTFTPPTTLQHRFIIKDYLKSLSSLFTVKAYSGQVDQNAATNRVDNS